MQETALKIKVFGDSVLRKKAKPVSRITDRHRAILSEMAQLMYASAGVGLAAPQVGISEAMIVADIGNRSLFKLINPKIAKREGRQAIEEGCLSVPGVCLKVRRAKKITVEALDESGKPVRIEAEDLLACVIQHEIDHLKGKLIIDYASFLDKIKFSKRLKKLKQRAEDERMSQPEAKSCKLQL
jgi:peptide deformylase